MAKSWDMTSGGKLLPPVEIEVEVLLEEEVFEEEASDDLPKKDNNNIQNNFFKRIYMYFYLRFKQKTFKKTLIEPLFCPCSAFKQEKKRCFLPFFFGLILDCF